MGKTASYKELFSKRNLYFIASFVVILLATLTLVILIKGQSDLNLEARELQESRIAIQSSITKDSTALIDLELLLDQRPKIDEIITSENNTTDLTRYMDNVFASMDTVSDPFVNTTLRFGEVNATEDLKYTDAQLSITSTKDNFFRFLEFVETTGIGPHQINQLMEIRSINISLPAIDEDAEEELLDYQITLRIFLS